MTPNKVQSFIINYEIKKLLDKAINIKNQKYRNIVYLNSNLSVSLIRNAMDFISNEYFPIEFKYSLIEPKEFNSIGLDDIEGLSIIRQD